MKNIMNKLIMISVLFLEIGYGSDISKKTINNETRIDNLNKIENAESFSCNPPYRISVYAAVKGGEYNYPPEEYKTCIDTYVSNHTDDNSSQVNLAIIEWNEFAYSDEDYEAYGEGTSIDYIPTVYDKYQGMSCLELIDEIHTLENTEANYDGNQVYKLLATVAVVALSGNLADHDGNDLYGEYHYSDDNLNEVDLKVRLLKSKLDTCY